MDLLLISNKFKNLNNIASFFLITAHKLKIIQ